MSKGEAGFAHGILSSPEEVLPAPFFSRPTYMCLKSILDVLTSYTR